MQDADKRPATVVAIDGPAGAGKSTVARRVASSLGLLYLDTGAMYRALALNVLAAGAAVADEAALAALLRASDIHVAEDPSSQLRVWLDGRDVTDAIRQPAVSAIVAQIASLPAIKAGMVERQRSLAEGGGVVMDGRDIGTYVLPQAPYKFFLTATLEARVARRLQELAGQGFAVAPDRLRADIVERDRLDSTRAVAPLQRAPDAHVLDTTNLTVDQVVQAILTIIRGQVI